MATRDIPLPPQQLLDQLIDLISSSPRDLRQFQSVLDQLDASEINRFHSSTRLSPLETLFSRYPHITELDLDILETLLEKGADLNRVDEHTLRKMIKIELEELSEPVKKFEARLIRKFRELDGTVEQDAVEMQQEDQPDTLSTSSLSTSTISSRKSPSRQRSLSSSPPAAQTNRVVSQTRLARSPSRTSRSASTSLPFPMSRQTTSSPHNPFQPSITRAPSPRRYPSHIPKLIRLFVALPWHTSRSYFVDYFHRSLNVLISDIALCVDALPCHAFFDIDAEIFQSGELRKRFRQAEDRGDWFRREDGITWRLEVRKAFNDFTVTDVDRSRGTTDGVEERKRSRRQEEGTRLVPSSKYHDGIPALLEGPKYAPRPLRPSRPVPQIDEPWIRLSFLNFSPEFSSAQIERILRKFLPYWKDLVISAKGQGVEVWISVKGERMAEIAEREGSKLNFEGRRVRVTRELIERGRMNVKERRATREEAEKGTRRRREESINQFNRPGEQRLKRSSRARGDTESRRSSKRRRRSISSNEGGDEDSERMSRSRSITSRGYVDNEGGGHRKSRPVHSEDDDSDRESSRSLDVKRRRNNDYYQQRSNSPSPRSSNQRHFVGQPVHTLSQSSQVGERWDSGGWNELEKERKQQFEKWEYNGNGGMRSWPRD